MYIIPSFFHPHSLFILSTVFPCSLCQLFSLATPLPFTLWTILHFAVPLYSSPSSPPSQSSATVMPGFSPRDFRLGKRNDKRFTPDPSWPTSLISDHRKSHWADWSRRLERLANRQRLDPWLESTLFSPIKGFGTHVPLLLPWAPFVYPSSLGMFTQFEYPVYTQKGGEALGQRTRPGRYRTTN
jgi:hypothetical protein